MAYCPPRLAFGRYYTTHSNPPQSKNKVSQIPNLCRIEGNRRISDVASSFCTYQFFIKKRLISTIPEKIALNKRGAGAVRPISLFQSYYIIPSPIFDFHYQNVL